MTESVKPEEPGSVDPRNLPYWTLTMVMAWIVRRDIGSVSLLTEEVRGRPVTSRHLLLVLAGVADSVPVDRSLSLDTATTELRRALASATLDATAVRIATGEIVSIDPVSWQQLDLQPRLDDVVRLNFHPVYQRLRFDPKSIITLWPPAEDAPPLTSAGTAPSSIDQRWAGTPAAMKRALEDAQTFMRKRGFSPPTKQEAEDRILAILFRSTQQSRRDAAQHIDNAKRRPSSILANRDNELEDCRRYLRQRRNDIRQRQ